MDLNYFSNSFDILMRCQSSTDPSRCTSLSLALYIPDTRLCAFCQNFSISSALILCNIEIFGYLLYYGGNYNIVSNYLGFPDISGMGLVEENRLSTLFETRP